MQILIEKDGATCIPREVDDMEAAQKLANSGAAVLVESGGEWVSLPPRDDDEPAAEDAKPAKKAKKTAE